jgi:glycosyltransferase involved in cell wall biosynthesis
VSEVEQRVLVAIHGPGWGGIHAIAERVGPAAAAAGFPWVVVLTREDSELGVERLEHAGLTVVVIPLSRIRKSTNPVVQLRSFIGMPLTIARLCRVIKKYDISIVQVGGLLHFHAAVAGRIMRCAVVWQLHSDQPPTFLKKTFAPMVRKLAHSIGTAGRLLADTHIGMAPVRDVIVPFLSPVDLVRFNSDEAARTSRRAERAIAEDGVLVGTVGGRGPNKNHQLLVEALHLARREDPLICVWICGAEQGQHRSWYQENVIDRADELGLIANGAVAFAHPGVHVNEYMNAFDIFALPSKGEGSPLVVAEAMATSLPVVANDVGSVSDSVIDGLTGLLCVEGTANELAQHLVRLAADSAQRAEFGTAGRAWAEEHLSVRACTSAHIEAYEIALGARRAK